MNAIAVKSLSFFVSSCLFLSAVLILGTGCSRVQQSPLSFEQLPGQTEEQARKKLLASDPEGPLPAPHIPQWLDDAASHPERQTEDQEKLTISPHERTIRYVVRCSSSDFPELEHAFLAKNTLTRRQDIPLYSIPALEQRLKISLKEGKDLLHSFGYYEGSIRGRIEIAEIKSEAPTTFQDPILHPSPLKSKDTPFDATVVIHFSPGPQYTIGTTKILLEPAHSSEEDSVVTPQVLPSTLEDVGLSTGDPALADDVLNAIERVVLKFHNTGFPKATIVSRHFYLNQDTHTLDAEVSLSPGPFMRMGNVHITNTSPVSLAYVVSKQPWDTGEPWSQEKIDAFREALRQTGLFTEVTLAPDTSEDTQGNTPVLTTLKAAPERTVGGALRYDTSFGPGAQAYWEHRNLTGQGDSLRFELPVWKDMQEFTAKYRLPSFMRPEQDFVAQGGLFHENTDAYELRSGSAAFGISRRLSTFWTMTLMGSGEGGTLKDPQKTRKSYRMLGSPITAQFDSTNSLLDATKGRAVLSLTPYIGEYTRAFTVLRSRLDAQRFYSLATDDSFILATRASAGAMSGASASHVPPSARFYSGGGGSVRGYAYQSLGPRNSKNDPLGGSALFEASLEPRIRFSEEWGMVAFLDGGNAYEDSEYLGRDLRWGAGIGLRFFTAIGPIRFDVATPLNPRDSDDPLHFYISIGQSF